MMARICSEIWLAIVEAPDDEHYTERFSHRSKITGSRPLTAQMSMVPTRTKLQARKRKKKSKDTKVQIETVTKIIPVGLNYMQTFLEKQIGNFKKVSRETQTEETVGTQLMLPTYESIFEKKQKPAHKNSNLSFDVQSKSFLSKMLEISN